MLRKSVIKGFPYSLRKRLKRLREDWNYLRDETFLEEGPAGFACVKCGSFFGEVENRNGKMDEKLIELMERHVCRRRK